MSTTPTRTSATIAGLVTLVAVVLLLGQVQQVLEPALVGVASALGFAACLWLVDHDRYRTVTSAAASLLTVPVAVGFFVGTVGVVLVLVSIVFPVADAGGFSVGILLLAGRAGVVFGCILAILGVVLGTRNVLHARSLHRYYWTTIKTGVVPLSVALVAGGVTTLSRQVSGQPGATVGTLLGRLLDWVLSPGPGGLHVASFLLVVTIATMGLRALIGALPVAELLADSGAGRAEERRVAAVRLWLAYVAVATAGLGLVGVFVDLELGRRGLAGLVGPALAGVVDGLTRASALRLLLVGLTAVAVPVVVAVSLLQRLARSSLTDALERAAPVAGGVLVTLVVLVTAGGTFRWLVAAIAGRLPGVFGARFEGLAGSVGAFYGPGTVMVGLVAGVVLLSALNVLLLRAALGLRYLSPRMAGYSLASGGLFVASALVGTLDAPAWLVFACVVASLVVWDAGEFGTTLGREIGRDARTRSGELVHAGGTLTVGLLGVGAALAVQAVLAGWQVGRSTATVAALLAVLVALVALVAALR